MVFAIITSNSMFSKYFTFFLRGEMHTCKEPVSISMPEEHTACKAQCNAA